MIEIRNLTKSFDDLVALSDISLTMDDGQIFGLIGTNGAGKSTLLRCLAGIYRPDQGEILVDGAPVYENPAAKSKIFFISDDQYFFPGGTPKDMLGFYRSFYPDFNTELFYEMMGILKLDPQRRIQTFSKGMKKQLSLLFGICSGCKYFLCDETFDGLDPVIRQAVKKVFIREVAERKLTPIIASHNLRELEDICDHVGLLHQGGILLSRDLDDMKLGIFKVQVVFRDPADKDSILSTFPLVSSETRGSLQTLTLRGERVQIETAITALQPVFYEILPLSLEEIFISETEVLGYDFKNLA
jgi:ABC-2 type transport system ATP-binding protein